MATVRAPVRRRLFRAVVRGVIRPALTPHLSVQGQRRCVQTIAVTVAPPRGIHRTRIEMDGIPAERSQMAEGGDMAILYLHGGGYIFGSPYTHRSIAGTLAQQSGAVVFAQDYRLAPEHCCPAAVEDARAAYRWLLRRGWPASRVVIVGDSAGGGLALSTAVTLRDGGDPLPAALGLLSPWVDLTLSGRSLHERAGRDPMLREPWLAEAARLYAGDRDPADPLCSPLFADLRGLPPLFIQVGTDEVLLSDAVRLEERARAGGGDVELRILDGLWHEVQLHARLLPDARAALQALARDLRRVCQPARVRTDPHHDDDALLRPRTGRAG